MSKVFDNCPDTQDSWEATDVDSSEVKSVVMIRPAGYTGPGWYVIGDASSLTVGEIRDAVALDDDADRYEVKIGIYTAEELESMPEFDGF